MVFKNSTVLAPSMLIMFLEFVFIFQLKDALLLLVVFSHFLSSIPFLELVPIVLTKKTIMILGATIVDKEEQVVPLYS